MGTLLWTEPIGPLKGGVSIAKNTFTTAADLSVGDGAGQVTLDRPLKLGSIIELEAWGVASNTATPTLAVGFYYGGVAGTALAVSAAKTTTTAMSNWPWWAWYKGRVTALGATGAIMGWGRWRLPTSLTAWSEFNLPETAIDTTQQKIITVGAAWSASSASNGITLHGFDVSVKG
jgi:hypothetical protein